MNDSGSTGARRMDEEDCLRVLLVGPVPPELGSSNPGGVARVVRSQAEALARRGHDVSILALGRYYKGDQRTGAVDILGLRLDLSRLVESLVRWIGNQHRLGSEWRTRNRLHLLYTTYRLAAVDDLTSFDVIHAHGPYNGCPLAASILGIGAPVVVSVHSYHGIMFGAASKRARRSRFYSNVFKTADAVVHVSDADGERGENLGVEWADSEFVVHNAVPGSSETRVRDLEGRDGVCFVGSLIERKGLPELLRLWRANPPENSTLRVVGEGALVDEVREAAAGVDRIEYLGYLAPEAVRRLLGRSLCAVVPSYSESFGLVYLEALQEGTPVVGYHRTLEEIATELECSEAEGRYIRPLDLEEEGLAGLRREIQEGLEARRADRKGEVARQLSEKVARVFGSARVAKDLESVYAEVLGKRQVERIENSGSSREPERDTG